MQKLIGLAVLIPLLAACSTVQKVEPAVTAQGETLCIIHNTTVREAFLNAYRDALASKGYQVQVVPFGAGIDACPLITVYNASWTFHMPMYYMNRAQMIVYRDGKAIGNAMYSAHTAGPSRFIRAEAKVQELVGLMLPTP